ncbi:MAG TPA: SDR family NAD(P)-dependent oxidoreductase [Vicinamibacteria bacterium]|nr:SDR family NAD(P)-dependent oxidoreductase [Vicinamibacteria bacterium]
MRDRTERAVAIVGVGAIMPDAPSAAAFRDNVWNRRYSIREVPPERWNVADYYDPDPAAPDKTYSKIGAWVRGFEFDWKRFHIPPRVAATMDESQQWAVTIAAEALADYGYPGRKLDLERTGVILGTAMGGELSYLTTLRICFPEFARALGKVSEFQALEAPIRQAILNRWHTTIGASMPPITEDTMPGELANIVSGRVANVLNLRGPNFIADAACASSLAALDTAVDLLVAGHCDAVLAGGVDRNMGVNSFVKFCKIGALSASGTRPFGEGADGFVMGEGSAVFLLRRLTDAERDGDRVYAVVRGVGGSSDGKGKGITAPNPIGQQLAVRRAWEDAGLGPTSATLIEAHGTSTKVGDVVEVESLASVFGGARPGSIALGSAKSNVGHLKAGAGAAGLLKAVFALHEKVLPPTLNAEPPNPGIDFSRTPFVLNHELREWPRSNGPRRAAVSAYGFGGTNFHVVLEEHLPGELTTTARPRQVAVEWSAGAAGKPPLRGLALLGAGTPGALAEEVDRLLARASEGLLPPVAAPEPAELAQPERLAVDFEDGAELIERLQKARKALAADAASSWRALQSQGIFRGRGPKPGKIAFLFTGQGSQYANMGRALAEREPAVAAVFAEADRVMLPILGRPLTSYLFVDAADSTAVEQAEQALMQTAITQPAVLTMDTAVCRLLAEYRLQPDMVMGHSLGEYGALVAAGVLPFAHALEAAAARGREMTRVSLGDNGWLAAVMAPLPVVEETLARIDGYVVPANINARGQCVIGGEGEAVARAIEAFGKQGYPAQRLPVSHAFHTRIVAPAAEPLRKVLDRLSISPPVRPLVANVTADFYPSDAEAVKELLVRQIASPVQWVAGLERLYASGVRTFVEVGPKRALKGFVDDVLGDRDGVVSLFTNRPQPKELSAFNQALCGLYAAGYGTETAAPVVLSTPAAAAPPPVASAPTAPAAASLEGITQLLTQTLERLGSVPGAPYDRNQVPLGSIVVSGTGLGLPGADKPVMDPGNAERILRGEQFVDLIPERFRALMAAKQVTRLVKGEDGGGHFETITDTSEVIKLAARPGSFDLTAEYGVPEKLVEALDVTTQLAMAAGLDALREAGIPLVQTYRKTTTGKHLPDRWLLPEALRDETGVVFASAFPGYDRLADELHRFYTYDSRRNQRQMLEELRRSTQDPVTLREIQRRSAELDQALAREAYSFDRRFLLRVLTMGHSQFAEYIGARGPNAHVNAACASTPQAVALAEDWIRSGRCRRVVVIGADNVTGAHLLEWIGAGFLATGAAATDAKVEEAALPFDRRRHGTLLGMGACALVLETQDAVEERGMRGIVELLATEVRNSAHHATRLDVQHIAEVMDSLITSAERRFGLGRHAMAPETVFMSHETFTPARGGSASAEVAALRRTFGAAASEIVVANTKGFTGHPMGVGIEDVIAVKILEHGVVPPVPNLRDPDPELGALNLSRGGRYPVKYAIHLAAGFGSQIALTLTRRIPGGLERTDHRALHQRWLAEMSGYDRPETEVVKRVLRVVAAGAPARLPSPSPWTYGIGPSRRAPAPGDGVRLEARQASPLGGGSPAIAPAAVPTPPPTSLPQPAAAAATVTSATPVPAPPAMAGPDPVTDKVLAIVAEKTGYPPDMLDLDLDLEADLGVDTVKQAETFAAVREAYGIPRQENLRLRDFPTLKHVVQFVFDRRPELAVTAAPTAPPASTALPATTAAGPDPVMQRVLAIVAEKTGYPPDMLDLDLDLEADLGVDTVKQAETFAAVREAYDIPRQENLRLRDFPTLKHVVQFVFDRRPELAAAAVPPRAPAAPSPVAPPAAPPAAARIEDADRMPRRVPVPLLRPSLDLCKPTALMLGGESRVVVVSDGGGVGTALIERLAERGVQVLALDAGLAVADLEARLKAWSADGRVQGVFWLPALDAEPPLAELDLTAFRELNRRRVKNLYATLRALYEQVAGAGSFLVAATRLGGLHGHGAEGAVNPLGGAVAGFTKAYKREQIESLVKVVDFAPNAAPAEVTEALIAEALADPGVVEVGYHDGLRVTIGLEEQPAADGRPGLMLGQDSVFLVTGAAGGITSAIVADLAAASGGTFYLLDLVPEPRRDDPKIALLRADREKLKLALIEEMKASGERPTPVVVDRQILAVERSEAALRAIEAVEAAGGAAHYRSLNLLDGPAVTAVVDEVHRDRGQIDVLVHAGGIEISRKLSEKEPEEFDLVFDIKADGFFSLLRATERMPLGATVVFSSVAGRFGNSGQTDYSAANALLCSLTSHLRRLRPETKALAIDWTAWGGIGMATRGSIPAVMQMAGIEMLPPEAGVPTVRRELTAGGGSGEVLVAGRLGILGQEWDETGGLDAAKVNRLLAARERPLLMIGTVTSARLHGGLTVATTLDPKIQPFLFDHQIEETPVLPGVMGTEAFAELSSVLCPGYLVAAIEDEEFLLPFKFFRMQPATLYLSATAKPEGAGELLVSAVLRSVIQPKPELPVQERVHFRSRVRMSREPLPRPLMAFEPPRPERLTITADAVYRVYFHGPAYRVIERAGVAGPTAVGLMATGLWPDTTDPSHVWVTAPRLLELCFQTAGLWLLATQQVMALPAALRRAVFYRQPQPEDARRLYAVVTAVGEGAEFEARVLDEEGNVYLELSGYRTTPLPGRTVLR